MLDEFVTSQPIAAAQFTAAGAFETATLVLTERSTHFRKKVDPESGLALIDPRAAE